jgi:hypothetical protein
MGSDQECIFGKRLVQQPAAGRSHRLGIRPDHHPVRMLDFDGVME